MYLRIGAEMNCWYRSESDYMKPEIYRGAYIRIAEKARNLCPNAALIFSVNSASYWLGVMTDFYPGDAYVDYVGVSAYSKFYSETNLLTLNGISDTEQMLRCLGKYSSPINVLREVTYYFPNKPLMITECGVAHSNKAGATPEMTNAAIRHINELYSCFLMVYPQIKAIVYFDYNPTGGFNYRLEDNLQVKASFEKAVGNNPALLRSAANTADAVYTKFSQYNDPGATIRLRSYCKSVNSDLISVSYTLDGALKTTVNDYPFAYDLNTAGMTDGYHELTVKFDDHHGYTAEKKYRFRTAAAVGACIAFTDVEANRWSEDNIYGLVLKGILNGFDNRDGSVSFQPQANVTREQFAKILAFASGEDLTPYAGKTSFKDVSANRWSAPSIAWAQQKGIVYGRGSGFAPEAPITREELSVMIYRYVTVYQQSTLPAMNNPAAFTDQGQIQSWAVEAIGAMQGAGIINGYPDGSFKPGNTASREEAATIMNQYLKLR